MLFSVIRTEAQFKISGSASYISGQCYELTPDVQNQQGNIISRQKIDVRQDFTIAVTMNFGRENFVTSGADGIAFVMMTDTIIPVSGNGGGIGYEGLTPSLVVEFDTYQNGDYNDPASDHIALIRNGNPNHASNTIVGPLPLGGGNIEDNQDHDVVFSWKAAIQEFTVYFGCNKVLGYVGPITGPFLGGENTVYWGFTASTGSARNRQTVCFKTSSQVDVLRDVTYCDSATVVLDGGAGGLSYKWTPQTGLSNPYIARPSVHVTRNTTFYLEKTDNCGNTTLDSMRVLIVPNTIALDLGRDTAICEGSDLVLTAQQSGASYTWSTGATTRSITVNDPGIYSVEVDDGNCKKQDEIEISALPLPKVFAGADTVICNRATAILYATAVDGELSWQDGTPGPQLQVDEEGTYTAIATNACGESHDDVRVEVKNCNDYFIPNIFSPNHDGVNDYFGPVRSDAIVLIEQLTIFDRWGAPVFEVRNITADEEEKMWDGTFRGSEANPGVYVYLIRLKLASGKTTTLKGSVTLVR